MTPKQPLHISATAERTDGPDSRAVMAAVRGNMRSGRVALLELRSAVAEMRSAMAEVRSAVIVMSGRVLVIRRRRVVRVRVRDGVVTRMVDRIKGVPVVTGVIIRRGRRLRLGVLALRHRIVPQRISVLQIPTLTAQSARAILVILKLHLRVPRVIAGR